MKSPRPVVSDGPQSLGERVFPGFPTIKRPIPPSSS